eukprot:SAG31_NODE_3456_length_4251_cov_3.651734_2_plen_359_part_00
MEPRALGQQAEPGVEATLPPTRHGAQARNPTVAVRADVHDEVLEAATAEARRARRSPSGSDTAWELDLSANTNMDLWMQAGHIDEDERVPFGDGGAMGVAAALETGRCARLVSLGLGGNEIGDTGATALARALMTGHCGRLSVLCLDYNFIGDRGAAALADAIVSEACQSLAELILGENKVGDAGALHLAGALRNTRCRLSELWLTGNQIGDTGAVALTEALSKANCGTLRLLHLRRNKINPRQLLKTERALAQLPQRHRDRRLTAAAQRLAFARVVCGAGSSRWSVRCPIAMAIERLPVVASRVEGGTEQSLLLEVWPFLPNLAPLPVVDCFCHEDPSTQGGSEQPPAWTPSVQPVD